MRYTKNSLNKVITARKQITNATTQSHFRKQYKCLEGKGLNPNQITILSYIYDTLELSWTNGDDFYDKKRHNYYAVVTRKTISNLYNLGESTVGEILQQLEDIGYIRKVHSLKGGLRVFPLHFIRTKHDTLNSSESKRSNLTSNNTHDNKTQSTSDTEHTSSDSKSSDLNIDDKVKSMVNDALKDFFGNNNSKDVQEKAKIDDKKDDQHLNSSIVGTNSLPKKANSSINIIARSVYPKNTKKRYNFIYDITGMIYKFKSAIFKKHDLYKQSRWENNDMLTNQFNTSIYEMLYNSFSGQREIDSSYAYFGGALRKFFTKIVNQLLGKHTESTQHVSKQKKTSVKGNHRIHEKLPDWARDDYNPEFHKISKSKKQEIEDRLKKLNTKLG